MRKKSRAARAPVDTKVDQERVDEEEMDDADLPGLPLGEGASVEEQIVAVLNGSTDDEIALVLGQAPIPAAMKLDLGMKSLSAAVDAFVVLLEAADACTDDALSFLFRKVAGLTSTEVDEDIRRVVSPDQMDEMLSQPEWKRRRLFFLDLAAPYLEAGKEELAEGIEEGIGMEEADGMQQEDVPPAPTAQATGPPEPSFTFGAPGAGGAGGAGGFAFGSSAPPSEGFVFGGAGGSK